MKRAPCPARTTDYTRVIAHTLEHLVRFQKGSAESGVAAMGLPALRKEYVIPKKKKEGPDLGGYFLKDH